MSLQIDQSVPFVKLNIMDQTECFLTPQYRLVKYQSLYKQNDQFDQTE